MFVKLQNHNVHLFEHNSLESSKDTILIIPGAGMDHRLGQMIDLESLYSEYTVLSIDLPGHGLTSGNWLESIEQMSDLCIDVISKLKINNKMIESSCCGMAGSFGYDSKHYEISKKMANLSLIPAVNNSDEKDFIIANGTSCRHQISDLSDKKGKHVSELLFKIFETVN